MSASPQIVAMGGGGFSMEPRNTLLDDHILSLTGRRRPRVCFVPTASGDSAVYVAKFQRAFAAPRAVATHLPLFTRDAARPPEMLLDQDVIYVGGGNTANMLAVWRLHGVDRLLRQAWRSGAVLCGLSAGMNCWFEACVTDSFGPLAALHDGLGLLRGAACPHFDGEADRRPALRRLIGHGFPPTLAADDGAAFHFVGRRLHECVSSRSQARCFRVERRGRTVLETPIATRFLGARGA